MSAIEKTIYKGMLDAGWPRDDANYMMRIIKANDGASSANLDPNEVNVKCKNGKYANLVKG